MEPGDVVNGFRVKGSVELEEVPATMWRMEHERTGADLVWLDRDDDNKTFCIAFKTIPSDDTGVAHILEHSVLCGSEAYPVKEPFVDLLKSSLYTFLNALTGSDRTYYPVSSRNDKDFHNLMDVYLDAVFHPLSVKSPLALAQEGWHYEVGEDGKLVRNGVVYSEMKGVFADPDATAYLETMRILFPGHCYGFESGGTPEGIPALTFARYKAFHARFYHPSNARIFLDGRMDVKTVLARIDGFLKPYERTTPAADIPWQKPVSGARTVAYPVDEGEDAANKTILTDGWVVGRFDDYEKGLAFTVLADVLAGSNESPLKKALLQDGLCEDVDVDGGHDQQTTAFITLRNVRDGKAAAARERVRATLDRLAREGLDHGRIAAVLDRIEFKIREKDSGQYPRGIAFLHAALVPWLYGGDPADAFRCRRHFDALRAKIDKGAFEALIREFFLDNPHHAEVTLVPSATVAGERRRADERQLAETLAGWTPEELARVKDEARRLKEFQQSRDRPEDVAKIPTLALADVPVKGPEVVRTISEMDGMTVIRAKAGVDGFHYAELLFSLEGLDREELMAVPFLTELLGELATARRGPLELKSAIDGTLGRFAGDAIAFRRGNYLKISYAALDAKRAAALDLVREVLLETRFDDARAADDLLKQVRQDMERGVADDGRVYAMRRAAARFSRPEASAELLDGLAQLKWLQRADAAALLKTIGPLAARIFTRGRLLLCVSDNVPDEHVRAIAGAFPVRAGDDLVPKPMAVPELADSEGWTFAAEIAFAGRAGRLPEGVRHHGSHAVATRFLSLDYLWNEIRVLGGAYGMGLSENRSGSVRAFTYRDPNPARSYGKFAEMGGALRRLAESDASIDKYVVSAIGKTEPYLTPRLEVTRASSLHLEGWTPADLQREREEILATTKADLRRYADVLDRVGASSSKCTVGGAEKVKSCAPGKTRTVAAEKGKGKEEGK